MATIVYHLRHNTDGWRVGVTCEDGAFKKWVGGMYSAWRMSDAVMQWFSERLQKMTEQEFCRKMYANPNVSVKKEVVQL